ncbi:hypothetical protein [Proteus sp. G2671]|uniref:hypothetical protein n=1 Tax=Proteus sp. G2671 TaxID=2698883 RepID=UPI001376D1D6|nr:hypothetical protein [Proteus sp. G2671]NBM04354.1 hypothetical protein [Proteus sp. G2671]
MFTYLIAAIEEARYLKSKSGGRVNFCVMQIAECMEVLCGLMECVRILYTTANDDYHTVLPEAR